MSKLSRVLKKVKPDPPIKEPEYKSTGSWGEYKHREVGPEVMRIVRPFKRGKPKRGSAWRGNNRLLQTKDEE